MFKQLLFITTAMYKFKIIKEINRSISFDEINRNSKAMSVHRFENI